METGHHPIPYAQVLEEAGFYHGGQALPEVVWSATELPTLNQLVGGQRDPRQIERAFRYQAVVRPESEDGRLGIAEVFELSGSPCIYFKRLDADLEAERLLPKLFDWHRAAWNHGQAPMLWIVTPTSVRILDAYASPPSERSVEQLKAIEILRFERIADRLGELRRRASRQQIESGLFWQQAGKQIDRKNRVDRCLIRGLEAAAKSLEGEGLELAEAHRLLLRALFASYLEARGWLSASRLWQAVGVDRFVEALESPAKAERLFSWLSEVWNGDVFPQGRSHPYSARQLRELRFFLEGGDPETRQLSLWPYEFDVVPVELLSSIYESFSHALDASAAKSRSMHYTPTNLVELTLGEVFDDQLFESELPPDAKVLDLACGSGVFLVEALRRLVSRRVAKGEALTRKLVRDTLYNQVFGVDSSGGAIHIAAISLYLAALELDPHPKRGNHVKFKTLVYPKDGSSLHGRQLFNLFEADAFDLEAPYNVQAPFVKRTFSMVVGNPPWTRPRGRRAGAGVAKPEELRHVEYCRARGIALPAQDPPDQAFLWRAADFTTPGARLGVILSARRFFSHHPKTLEAREHLGKRFTPRLLVNLSSLRQDSVFPTSTHPGMVFIASAEPASGDSAFSFITLESSATFREHGTLELGPELVRSLGVRRFLRERDLLRIAVSGEARDVELLQKLQGFPSLVDCVQTLAIEPSQGFIRGKIQQRKRPVDPALLAYPLPCLEKEGFRDFELEPERLPLFDDRAMQWPRKAAIYRGPLLLVKLGLGERGISAAFSETDVVYSQRYVGIPLPSKASGWGACLNGILNSSLATYFFFLTSSEWGVERDNVPWNDIRRLPVPSPSQANSGESRRLIQLVNRLRQAARNGKTIPDQLLETLDEVVFDLYGLDDHQRILVRDMVHGTIDFHRRARKSAQAHPPNLEELCSYAENFMDVSNEFLSARNRSKLVAEIFDFAEATPLRVVKFRLVDRRSTETPIRHVDLPQLEPLLESIAADLPESKRGVVHIRRHLRIYSSGELYVVKPAQRRFWARSAGLNDADAVLAEHMRTL